jgi:hypothetical protein
MEILEAIDRMRKAPNSNPDHVFQLIEPTLSLYRSKPPAVTPFSLGSSRVILECAPWRLGRMKSSLGRQVRGFEEARRRRIINAIIQCRSTMDAEFLYGEAIASEIVQTRLLVFGEVHPRDSRKPLQELHHEAIGEMTRVKESVGVAAPLALVRRPHGIIWSMGNAPASFDDAWTNQGSIFVPFDPRGPSYRLNEFEGLAAFFAEARPRVHPHSLGHLIHWMLEPWPNGTCIVGLGSSDDPSRCVCTTDAHSWFVQWAQKEEEGRWDSPFETAGVSLVVRLPDGAIHSISYDATEGRLTTAPAGVPDPQDDSQILWEA